jgi:hypothetical protein
VAASPENSAARAAMLPGFELVIVIDVLLGTLLTLCLEQIADRTSLVVT